VERRLLQEDPGSVAALIVEPITGAGSGAIVPPPGYFEELRRICDRHDLLLIGDEVVTGFGRTGAFFASAHFQATPDIITFGKGVSSGYAPLGGIILHRRVIDALDASEATGVFTGYTYSGHAVSCAAGLEVMRLLTEQDLTAKAAENGAWFIAEAKSRLRHRIVGDIRGKGLLIGIEFVADRASKQPFPADCKVQPRIVAAALKRDLLIRGETGVVDGVRGDHLLLAPPLIASRAELDEILTRLAEAIDEVGADLS
jgi:adenosylmethionine-8-amino-7-oxononanoate aminotransferase